MSYPLERAEAKLSKDPSFFSPIKHEKASGVAYSVGRAADGYWGGRNVKVWKDYHWEEKEQFPPKIDTLFKVSKVFLGIATLGLLPIVALIIKPFYRDAVFWRINKDRAEKLDEIINSLKQRAEDGDAKAMLVLGLVYSQGIGKQPLHETIKDDKSIKEKENINVKRDKDEAGKWFDKIVQTNDAETLFLLGNLFDSRKKQNMQYGMGDISEELNTFLLENSYDDWNHFQKVNLEDNRKKAVQCYQKAAENNYPAAIYEMGRRFYFADGMSEDKGQGRQLLEKAKQLGDEKAGRLLSQIAKEHSFKSSKGEVTDQDFIDWGLKDENRDL